LLAGLVVLRQVNDMILTIISAAYKPHFATIFSFYLID